MTTITSAAVEHETFFDLRDGRQIVVTTYKDGREVLMERTKGGTWHAQVHGTKVK